MSIRILALDLATNLGWAKYSVSDDAFGCSPSITCGCKNFSVNEDYDDHFARVYRIHEYMERSIGGIDVVCYEYVQWINKPKWGRIYYSLESAMIIACERRGIKPIQVLPSDVKREATGKGGRVDKKDMIAAARGQWPHLKVFDDNVADALWILRIAMRKNKVKMEKHHAELGIEYT